ncbi:hypothetical protein GOBAR_AA27991 [Gossypium barbadense]|uniref:Uncharacterized protein n=1 Tax=Gossypium barbadense TaxID=3634 RepID=A0A2P5WNL8_GOSBA|nr:hypothetical protein GOBAR_AA27991 [Gossypium barbadense]
MLTKFISMLETRFQNIETVLKNQQASIQGLETQIRQLAKLISERPQGSLPSNTESNPKEQLNAITTQDGKGLVASEPEPRQETVKSISTEYKPRVPYSTVTRKDRSDEKFGELTLRVGDETITLQARNLSNTSKIEGACTDRSTKTGNMVQPTLQEISSKNIREPCSSNKKGPIHEERRLQIEELDEWRTYRLRKHNKPKPSQDELNTLPNQLKVGDKVLLDTADPRIATSEPNEEILLTVHSIFSYGTVEIIHPKFSTFKAHGRALSRAHINNGDTAVRYDRVKQGPWAKLPKQQWRVTRLYFETMVETENLARACDTFVPNTRGRHCQTNTGMGEANEEGHGHVHQQTQGTRAWAKCLKCLKLKITKHTGKN